MKNEVRSQNRRTNTFNDKAVHRESATTAINVNTITRALAEMAGVTMGSVIPQVSYNAANKEQKPPFIIRHISPMAGLLFAFGDTQDHSEDVKVDTATDVDGVDGATDVLDNSDGADDALYYLSPMASAFSTRVWRIVDTFLKSGLGARQNVTLAAFIRYVARVQYVACTVRSMLNLLYILDHYDFKDDQLGNDRVLFDKFVESTGLLDPNNQQLLKHIVKQMSALPVFPNLVNETVRMLEPFTVDNVENTLHIPQFIPWEESGVTAGTQLELCEDYLTYITGSLTSAVATMSAFIPTTFQDTGIFGAPAIGYDPIKTSGAFNSSFELLNIVGNNTSPDDDENTMIQINDPAGGTADLKPGIVEQAALSTADGVPFMTKHDSIASMEFLSSTVWLEIRSATPDSFMLLTPHQWGRAVIFNDDETFDTIDGANLSATLDHLAPFLNNKFPGRSDELSVTPGYRPMQLELNASMGLVTRFAEVLFHTDQLNAIAHAQLGRSVKFGMKEVREAFLM